MEKKVRPLSVPCQESFMEAFLNRLTAPGEDAEELWSDLEEQNQDSLVALTKEVSSLEKTLAKQTGKSHKAPGEDDEEGEDEEDFCESGDEEEEGMGEYSDEYMEDDDEDFDSEDEDMLEDMDPKEQLRLLMQPCKDEPGFSNEDDEDEEDQEDNEDDEDQEDGEEDEEDEPSGKKIKFDILNANGDSDSDREEAPKSAFEKQQARLRRSIAALESENIGSKDWTMRGEVTATARPTDSLLQEDLEFEHVAKLAPTITVDVTESLEDLIRKRIKGKAFDDVERVPEEILAEQQRQKAKRQIELNDEKSKMSLVDQYEADFHAAQKKKARQSTDLKDEANIDPALKAQHDEIRKLFGKLCQSIDVLSENKFAPRTYELADAEIKTIKK